MIISYIWFQVRSIWCNWTFSWFSSIVLLVNFIRLKFVIQSGSVYFWNCWILTFFEVLHDKIRYFFRFWIPIIAGEKKNHLFYWSNFSKIKSIFEEMKNRHFTKKNHFKTPYCWNTFSTNKKFSCHNPTNKCTKTQKH